MHGTNSAEDTVVARRMSGATRNGKPCYRVFDLTSDGTRRRIGVYTHQHVTDQGYPIQG